MEGNNITGKRDQTSAEEVFNTASHGIALLSSVLIVPFLIRYSAEQKDMLRLAGAGIFGISLILLYLVSTLYHITPKGKKKLFFQKLDHAAIFILIAGTYTPITLGPLRGQWGWILLGFVWTVAIIGVSLKVSGKLTHRKVSNILYLAMGWSAVMVIKPIVTVVPGWGLFWLSLGGLFYSFGIFFYIKDNHKFMHFVWHLFVIAGSVSHVIAVWWFT